MSDILYKVFVVAIILFVWALFGLSVLALFDCDNRMFVWIRRIKKAWLREITILCWPALLCWFLYQNHIDRAARVRR